MLERLRNFMFVRRYELTATGIKERPNITGISMLTVTLPSVQVHSDIKIKSICLDNFMNKLRYHYGKFSYVWKAESQKNLNIHFHFILDIWINRNLVDSLWWDSIELLGYVTSYEKKFGKRTPPTNRIERAHSNKKVIGYATKYVAKLDEYRPVQGQAWHCSKNLQTEVKINIVTRHIDEVRIKKILFDLGLYCSANEYGEKYYLSDVTNIKKLPKKLRDLYENLIVYHLGRQECEGGMERSVTFDEFMDLRSYQKKCKLPLRGYEVFEENLFADSAGSATIKKKKVNQRKEISLKEVELIHKYQRQGACVPFIGLTEPHNAKKNTGR